MPNTTSPLGLVLAARVVVPPAALVGHLREDTFLHFASNGARTIFQMVRRRPIITIPALRIAPSRIADPALRPFFLEFFLALLVVRYFINPVRVVVPPVVAF